MKRIIGIDPGKHGAIVVLDRALRSDKPCKIVQSHKIPYNDTRVDVKDLRLLLSNLGVIDDIHTPLRENDIRVYIEERAMFGEKVPSYDYNYGIVDALCEIRFPTLYAPVRGGKWQKEFCAGLHGRTKEHVPIKQQVQAACIKIFGEGQCATFLYHSTGRYKGTFNHNFADAAGIAYYGWLVSEMEERIMKNVISENGKPIQRSSG